MKEITLKASKRTQSGKSYAKNIRKQGLIPAVIYGTTEPVMVEIEERQLQQIIYTNKSFFINIEVDGKNYKCIKQDAQFHAVSDQMLHIDFLAINDEKPVRLFLPIVLTGNSIGVQAGGHLYQLKRYLQAKSLPKFMPDDLVIDITNLDLGKTLQVKDLKFENIELLDSPNDLVVMVQMTRAAVSQQQEEQGKK